MNVTARALAGRAAVAVLALALCGTATCSLAQSGTPDKPTVRVVVQSLMQATLSAEIAARITRMPFRDGDAFRKGDVLVAFDCDIFEAQRDKVEAELKAAQAKLDNDRQLAATRSIGALEVILSEVSLQRAQAELRMARINTDR